jgi:hypothetical protein
MSALLTRDEFREAVFKRDNYKCVMCLKSAIDAHHIIERRLFSDGGYYINNGVSVCEEHHLAAESTLISCDTLREQCGINEVVLPSHLYHDQVYDKWSNPILPNGIRLKGELFHDESVQKVIKPVLHLFTDRVKHPRTQHLPWSLGLNSDDRVIENLSYFDGEDVVVTVKMDGEQTSMDRRGFHARSIDSSSHPSRDWLWGLHRRIGHEIEPSWRICGENLFAKHSIYYKNLPAYFMVHSVWNDKNESLAWDDVEDWAKLLDLETVPVIYRGVWNESRIRSMYISEFNGDQCEGYVVRIARSFRYVEFKNVVAKYVRENHVQTNSHWMKQPIIRNGLK